jgi:hypothetical protein
MVNKIYESFGAVFGTAVLLFLCFLALLWFLLPLILYQIRNRLDTLIVETKPIRKAALKSLEKD